MMSKKVNKDWMERNVNATMLAFMLDIDFETIEISYKYDSAWAKKLNDNEISKEDLLEIAQERWGVIQELNVVLKACK